MDKELTELLCSCPLLSCLSLDDWKAIGAGQAIDHIDQGDFLYRQGDPADRLFIVVDGEVVLQEVDHPAAWFASLAQGELAGSEALAAGTVYAYSAMAVLPSRVWMVPGTVLRAHFDAAFGSALQLLAALSAGLCVTVRDISCRKLQSAPERLASYLADLAQRDKGPALLTLPLPKKDLAQQLGMEPETLSRAFVKLRRLGVRTAPSQRIAIHDVAALQDFAVRVVADWGRA